MNGRRNESMNLVLGLPSLETHLQQSHVADLPVEWDELWEEGQ